MLVKLFKRNIGSRADTENINHDHINMAAVNDLHHAKYCRANQEWQWRSILFTNASCTNHELARIDRYSCINPILRLGLMHKWFIDYKSLITL